MCRPAHADDDGHLLRVFHQKGEAAGLLVLLVFSSELGGFIHGQAQPEAGYGAESTNDEGKGMRRPKA